MDAKNVVTKLKAEAAIQEKELAEKQKEANDALIMIKVIKVFYQINGFWPMAGTQKCDVLL